MSNNFLGSILVNTFLVLCMLAGPSAIGLTWSTYKNPRYGFEVMVPEFLTNNSAIGDEDGRVFESHDGRAKLVVFGFLDKHEYGSKLYLEKVIGSSTALEGETEVQLNEYSITIRGRSGDDLFFESILFTCKDKVVNVARLTCSIDQADLFRELEEKIFRRFSGGLGSRTPICN